jgi:hypothetical protein
VKFQDGLCISIVRKGAAAFTEIGVQNR